MSTLGFMLRLLLRPRWDEDDSADFALFAQGCSVTTAPLRPPWGCRRCAQEFLRRRAMRHHMLGEDQ